MDTVLWLCPSLPTETLKWLSLLPILMHESFWWWQCSDRYIVSHSPHLHVHQRRGETGCSPVPAGPRAAKEPGSGEENPRADHQNRRTHDGTDQVTERVQRRPTAGDTVLRRPSWVGTAPPSCAWSQPSTTVWRAMRKKLRRCLVPSTSCWSCRGWETRSQTGICPSPSADGFISANNCVLTLPSNVTFNRFTVCQWNCRSINTNLDQLV